MVLSKQIGSGSTNLLIFFYLWVFYKVMLIPPCSHSPKAQTSVSYLFMQMISSQLATTKTPSPQSNSNLTINSTSKILVFFTIIWALKSSRTLLVLLCLKGNMLLILFSVPMSSMTYEYAHHLIPPSLLTSLMENSSVIHHIIELLQASLST